jgi:hypothetical protein
MALSAENRIVRALWIGPALSTLERLALASWLTHGHEVHLYAYAEIANVPPGVVLRDASEVISEREIFTHTERSGSGEGSPAGFANWFRYEVLHANGGWWADTDVIGLRPWEFSEPYCFGLEDKTVVNVAVMKAPAGSDLTRTLRGIALRPHVGLPWEPRRKRLVRLAQQMWRRRHRWDLAWGQTGPQALTAAVKHLGLGAYVKPTACFYPIHYDEWPLPFSDSPRARELVRESHAVHLWNEMLRRGSLDKNATFHPASLIEEWKARYL